MKTFNKIYVRLITALLPLLFLPLIIDGLGFGKLVIAGVLVMLGILLWIVGGVMRRNEFKIYWTPVLSMAFLWAIWAAVSYFYMPLGVRMRTLMSTSGLGYILVVVGMMFLWVQNSDEGEGEQQLKWLTVSGLLVAVASLVVFLIPTSKLPILIPKDNPMLAIDQNWSLVGGILSELIFLIVLAVVWLKKMIGKMQNKENYIWSAIILGVLVLVSFLDIFRVIKSGWGYLDWGNSWIIAVESLKQYPKNIFGVGIGNFMEGFYWWRGIGFNTGANWSVVYSISGNYFTQLWAETGLVGLVIMLLMVWKTIKVQTNKVNKFLALGAGLLILVLPFSWFAVLMWIWFVMNLGLGRRSSGEISLKVGEFGFNIGPALVLVVVIGGLIWSGGWWRKIALSEYYYRNSLVAASKNDGSGTYNWQIKAIALNENVPEYRRSYSQTNLALALSLLQNKDITEDDKQKAVTLVQQSVREGKAAVALDSLNPSYWTNLAVIYKQLVGVIDGSADWSAQAYSQAGVLDTINPALRLDFGGLLYALGSYDQADRVFEQAVTLKSDLANSWYNWAYTAKQLNRLGDAVARLTQAVNLVPAGSGDYEKANSELTIWKKELDELTAKQKAASAEALAPKPETLEVAKPLPTGASGVIPVPSGDLNPPAVLP